MGITVVLHEFTGASLVTRIDRSQWQRNAAAAKESGVNDGVVGGKTLDEFLAGVERKAYQICFYSLRDEQAALDVVQDSMLKLVENYADRASTEWPALFFTILHHRITNMHRWKKLRDVGGRLISIFKDTPRDEGQGNLLETDIGVALMPEHARPDSETLGAQLRNRIDRAMQRLSKRQREVFLLREWQGFNVRETATILGCSEGSVKQHHFRAVRALRSELAEVWVHEKE